MLFVMILFPTVGCVVIAFGVLTAVFNERSSRIQRKYIENFTLFGRWTSRLYTPERVRGGGILIASFGVIWLALVLIILFAGK